MVTGSVCALRFAPLPTTAWEKWKAPAGSVCNCVPSCLKGTKWRCETHGSWWMWDRKNSQKIVEPHALKKTCRRTPLSDRSRVFKLLRPPSIVSTKSTPCEKSVPSWNWFTYTIYTPVTRVFRQCVHEGISLPITSRGGHESVSLSFMLLAVWMCRVHPFPSAAL